MGVQVNLATKDREGNPLSINKRQFISFSYGGKNIEDFDLLAVFSNDRLEKEMYAPFSDITSKNDVIDGQIFWLSVLDAERLAFHLATDGMTSENYEAFKNWFVPGQARELVLTEFPNRAILARVAAPPQISLLPFEDKKELVIAGEKREISTSLYKGDITLEFVMDDPYWYSLQSYVDDSAFNYKYKDEELKMIYEDKIPSIRMFSQTGTFLLGGNTIIQNKIASANGGIDLSLDSSLNLYNCGTNSAKPIISFSFKPEFSSDTTQMVISPGNSYTDNKYSTLTIGNQTLTFTTPSLLTSYNQAILIANQFTTGDSILDLRSKIRDELHNYYIRAWAMSIIEGLKNNASYVAPAGNILNINEFIPFFCRMMNICIESSTFDCIINSKTGEAKFRTYCRVSRGILDTEIEASNMTAVPIEENAGDMIRSKYLTLEDRTTFNEKGRITEEDCIKISSSMNLTNFKIDFKYTYL